MRVAPLGKVALGEGAVLFAFWLFLHSTLMGHGMVLIASVVVLAVALVAVPFLVAEAPARWAMGIAFFTLFLSGHFMQMHKYAGVVTLSAQAMFWDTVWLIVTPSLALYSVVARRSAALPKDAPGRGWRVWREIGIALAMAVLTLLAYAYGMNGEALL